MSTRFIIACTLATLFFIDLGRSHANPTSKQPERPMAGHGTIEGAKQRIVDLYQLYNEEEALVIKYYDTMNDPTRWSDRQIAKSAGRLWQARRDASHLKLMGEPAALDLERKLTLLAIQVDRFGQTYRGTPKGNQLVARIQTKLRREAPAMARFLEQANRALQQGKLDIFETQMEKKGVDLYEQLVFFTPTARKPFNGPFNSLLHEGDALLSKQRKDEYMAIATDKLAEHAAAANSFAAEARRVAGELAANGSASLTDEKEGDAIDSFAHVVTHWGNASAGLARAAAVQWAFTDRARVQVQPTTADLKSTALAALAGIVEAAAKSTATEDVQATYSGLLQQISYADRRIANFSDEVFKACEPALGKLIAKDPALAQRIARYERATSEALKWRREYAYQQAQNLERQFPVATTHLSTQAEPPKDVRPNFGGSMTRQSRVAPNTFTAPANWMVQDAAAYLVGKPVSEETMLRLSPASQTAVVPHDSLHFANVPIALDPVVEVQDLETAIVVDAEHGPLSRESADAVSAATLHDCLGVGGLIEQVHLESVVTRFASLPDLASPLIPLGKLPELQPDVSPLSHTCWRLDIRPMWAQHRYYTVRAK